MRTLTAGYIQQTNKPSGGPDDRTKKTIEAFKKCTTPQSATDCSIQIKQIQPSQKIKEKSWDHQHNSHR